MGNHHRDRRDDQGDTAVSAHWRFHERHFSAARLGTYVSACAGDRDVAAQLYRWNGELSGELWIGIGHLEVALRNAIDRQLTLRNEHLGGGRHWIYDERCELGRGRDRNARPYVDISAAMARVRKNRKTVEPNQVISEIPFGFWHQLVSKRQMFLWPDLAGAFPHMPGRRQDVVAERIGRLRMLRNRIGHHHRIWALDIAGLHGDMVDLADFIDPALGEWIRAATAVTVLLDNRPGPPLPNGSPGPGRRSERAPNSA